MKLRFIPVIEELLRGGQRVRFRAPGGSMHPTIRDGEIITVGPLGRSPVRVGDVVLYRRGRAAIAHRVIRLPAGGSSGFVLRGDAAHSCDRPIKLAQVLGRVLSIERDGRRVRVALSKPVWSQALGRVLRAAHAFG
jgi:signal peptidase I